MIVEEFNTGKFRFYSSNGNHIVTTLIEKRLTDCFKTTEKWIAVMIKGSYYYDPEWQIFDYNGKVICESVFRIFQVRQMRYAIGSSLLYPNNETLWIFNFNGEFKTKIEGYRFEFEDENYIKIYSSSGCFQIYDLNGNNIVYEVYNKYEVNSNDLTCTNQNVNNKKIVTLITCDNINGLKRLIIHAKQKSKKF